MVKVELPLCPKWDNKGMCLVSPHCNIYYYLTIYLTSSIFLYLCYSWSQCITFWIFVIWEWLVHKRCIALHHQKDLTEPKPVRGCWVWILVHAVCVCYDSSRFIISWQMELFTSDTAYRGHGTIKTDGLHFSHVSSHLPNRSSPGCQERCRGGFHLHPG